MTRVTSFALYKIVSQRDKFRKTFNRIAEKVVKRKNVNKSNISNTI